MLSITLRDRSSLTCVTICGSVEYTSHPPPFLSERGSLYCLKAVPTGLRSQSFLAHFPQVRMQHLNCVGWKLTVLHHLDSKQRLLHMVAPLCCLSCTPPSPGSRYTHPPQVPCSIFSQFCVPVEATNSLDPAACDHAKSIVTKIKLKSMCC